LSEVAVTTEAGPERPTLLALKIEGATSQGMWWGGPLEAEKGKGTDFLKSFQKEYNPADTLILAQ